MYALKYFLVTKQFKIHLEIQKYTKKYASKKCPKALKLLFPRNSFGIFSSIFLCEI